MFLTNLWKGVLENLARKARCFLLGALIEAGLCRDKTKAGFNMAVLRKCSNQPPAGRAELKCSGLKSFA